MADRLGPRACAVCGPVIEGCWRCGAKYGHRHLDVVDRHGKTVGRVAACDVHAPSGGPTTAVVPSAAPASPGRLPDRAAKRARDRERRQAQKVVLDRHAAEVATELEAIRAGGAA